MRMLVTGGTGVLGQAFRPLAEADGHQVKAPGRDELDLFDPAAVGAAVRGIDAVLHLATRIQPLDRMQHPKPGKTTTGCAPRPRPSWSTPLWPPTSRRMFSRPSPSSTQATGQSRRTRRSEKSRSSCAPRLPPRSRSAGSPPPGGAAWCCAWGCSTDRVPARIIRIPAWAPRCIARMPDARCSQRLPSPAASTTSAGDSERVSNRRFAEAAGWHAMR